MLLLDEPETLVAAVNTFIQQITKKVYAFTVYSVKNVTFLFINYF